MNSFVVILRDIKNKNNTSTVCRNGQEVSDLLTHIDEDLYSILTIEAIENFTDTASKFYKKTENLETGKK